MGDMSREVRSLLCDPQTSGGLLLAVTPDAEDDVKATAAEIWYRSDRDWRTGRGPRRSRYG
ncbi:selenophosphate synthetase [Salmonella enterica subsp. enterica]|nr:selenophosphate synthetase [Salmonella enterica subsp. enterica]